VAESDADKQVARQRLRQTHQRTLAVSRDANRSSGRPCRLRRGSKHALRNAEEIAEKLGSLKAAGIEYVILNIGGQSRDSLRSFELDIMPALSDARPLLDRRQQPARLPRSRGNEDQRY
jgi:hypothetical protein